MTNKIAAKLNSVKVKLKLPFLDIEGDWKADEKEQNAAWELYVELVTRIAVERLNEEAGHLREALDSLYFLSGEIRRILKAYGPSVARPKGGALSFGYIAIVVLNSVLRPFLTHWHPLLSRHEKSRKRTPSVQGHELKWAKNREMRKGLEAVRINLTEYSDILAEVAGVKPIKIRRE